MRILIADGDQEFLEVARRYLARRGLEAKIATNGLESADLLRRQTPDVVVLQQELLWGGSDGVRALMQQDPRWSEIPVILTSHDDWPEESETVAGAPFAACLRKPYRLEDLWSRLQAFRRDGFTYGDGVEAARGDA